jgi:hypothetical protein
MVVSIDLVLGKFPGQFFEIYVISNQQTRGET